MPALRRRYHKLPLLAQPYPWQHEALGSEGCWPQNRHQCRGRHCVFFRPPLALLGLFYVLLGAYAIGALRQRWRLRYSLGLIAVSYALVEGVAMALGAG